MSSFDNALFPRVRGASFHKWMGAKADAGITTSWQSWTRPKNAKWLWLLVGNGGQGGGGGRSGGAGGTARGGGGAGGTGPVSTLIIRASLLPRELFILTGAGGAGGAAGAPGVTPADAAISMICISPNPPASNSGPLLVLTGGNGGGHGGDGGTTTTAAGGGGGVINSTGINYWVNAGIANYTISPLTGGAGASGALAANAAAISMSTNVHYAFPGTGGGSADTSDGVGNGGNYTSLPAIVGPAHDGGVGGATGGADGTQGRLVRLAPFLSIGGTGGGAGGATGNGGIGGNGGPCAGGGGGGGGIVGGAGGRGGPGIVMIMCW